MKDAQNAHYLKSQYGDSRNLDARVTLHRRFGTNKQDFQRWIWDVIQPDAGEAVLECGCGPGHFWRANLDRLPQGLTAVLTDLSAGMVAEAEAMLSPAGDVFRFQSADIASLPFEDDSFDTVIANHMLYHVPDGAAALREVRRVLRPGGRFVAATNGDGHMEELFEFGAQLYGQDDFHFPLRPFTLENGALQLEPYFAKVDLRRYEDRLVVTEAKPIIDYLLSANVPGLILRPQRQAALNERLQRLIDVDGAIVISKSTGVFVARGAPES